MAVARDDLGADRLGAQAQHLADMFLDRGSMLAKVPTAPEIAPVAIFLARVFQAGAVAVHLGVEAREGQAHRGGFGMDAVAAADADVSLCSGAGLQRGQHPVHALASSMSAARTSWMFSVVSSTSEEVMP
jgi:hypothetical protein